MSYSKRCSAESKRDSEFPKNAVLERPRPILSCGTAFASTSVHQEEKIRRNDMKKTTKKNTSKATHKKAVKDLEVKPTKGGTVRGGTGVHFPKGK